MNTKPAWMSKHTCEHCDAGYLECFQGWRQDMKCCMYCNHPGRWQPEPYTEAELAEMRQQ